MRTNATSQPLTPAIKSSIAVLSPRLTQPIAESRDAITCQTAAQGQQGRSRVNGRQLDLGMHPNWKSTGGPKPPPVAPGTHAWLRDPPMKCDHRPDWLTDTDRWPFLHSSAPTGAQRESPGRSAAKAWDPGTPPNRSEAPIGAEQSGNKWICETTLKRPAKTGHGPLGLFAISVAYKPGAAQGCAPGYRIRPFSGP
jgi:hypothetical protein